MKELAQHQKELVSDATISLGNSVNKLVRSYSDEAGRTVHSIGEDIRMSIHQTLHPEEYAQRTQKTVHTPIDLSRKARSDKETESDQIPRSSSSECETDKEEKDKESRFKCQKIQMFYISSYLALIL